MLMAALLLAAIVMFRNKGKWEFPHGYFKEIFILAFFGIFITNAFEFWGLKYLNPTKTCFLFCLTPFATCLLSYLYLKEKITPKKVLALSIGAIGAAIVLLLDKPEDFSWTISWPELSVITASFATAFSWIIMRGMLQRSKQRLSVFAINCQAMLIGGIFLLILSTFTEKWEPIPVTHFAPYLGWVILTVFVSNLVGYNLYSYLLTVFSASFISFIGFLTPFMTAIYQWIFFFEPLSLALTAGALITGLGLYLFYKEEKTQNITPHVVPNE